MWLSEAVNGFIIARVADGFSHNTINIYRHYLIQFMACLSDATLNSPRFEQPEISPVTQDEIAKLLQSAEHTGL